MICSKCGEQNSEGFRFCGMCGSLLEARKPAGAPRVPTTGDSAQDLAALLRSSSGPHTSTGAPPAAVPSFLGLNQPTPTRHEPNGPTLDVLRDKSFSGLDSFFEPEEPRTGTRRIVLLLVLVLALGAAGWWAFSNYDKIGSTLSANSQSASAKPASEPPDGNSPSNPSASPSPSIPQSAPTTDATPSQPATPGNVPPSAAENTSSAPEAKPEDSTSKSPAMVATKPAEPKHPAPPLAHTKTVARSGTPTTRPSTPTPASDDKGDGDFRKGDAYLYGRGAPENCDEAIKNLKAASTKQNAKARSTFGTMYATGHCVPRDLPTSYNWFALALRADPTNQILEKDLVAVWNQMTPPERQMAMKMKQ
jgi:hypothetical protein